MEKKKIASGLMPIFNRMTRMGLVDNVTYEPRLAKDAELRIFRARASHAEARASTTAVGMCLACCRNSMEVRVAGTESRVNRRRLVREVTGELGRGRPCWLSGALWLLL